MGQAMFKRIQFLCYYFRCKASRAGSGWDKKQACSPLTTIRHHDQCNLESKGFFWLQLPRYCSLSKEVRTGTETQQEIGGRSSHRSHTGVLLTSCSVCSFTEPRSRSLAASPPSLIKKMPYSWILWRYFLN